MKKFAMLTFVFALLAPAIFAAPTDEEVMASFTGVFGVYGAIFLTSMMEQTVPGAEMDMDMESGASTLTFKNVDTAALFTSIGETLDGSGDMPEIPFSHISGTFATDSEGNLIMDITLVGGSISRLEMVTQGEDVISLKANGRDYIHLTTMMMDMGL